MFCPRCGNESPDGMLFCDKCGNPLPIIPNPQMNYGMMYGTSGTTDVNGTPNMMENQNFNNSKPKKQKIKKEKPPKTGKKKSKVILFLIFFFIVLVGGMYLGIKLFDSGVLDLSFIGLSNSEHSSTNVSSIDNENIVNTITYNGYQLAPNFDYDITHQNDKLYLNIDGTIATIEYHPEINYDDMVRRADSLKADIQKTVGNNYYVGDPTTLYKYEKQFIEIMIYDISWKPFAKVFYTGKMREQGVWIATVAPVDYDKYEDVLNMVIRAEKTSKVYSADANEMVLPNLSILEQTNIPTISDGVTDEILSGDFTGSGDFETIDISGEFLTKEQENI